MPGTPKAKTTETGIQIYSNNVTLREESWGGEGFGKSREGVEGAVVELGDAGFEEEGAWNKTENKVSMKIRDLKDS